jgi:hypothetical protein
MDGFVEFFEFVVEFLTCYKDAGVFPDISIKIILKI